MQIRNIGLCSVNSYYYLERACWVNVAFKGLGASHKLVELSTSGKEEFQYKRGTTSAKNKKTMLPEKQNVGIRNKMGLNKKKVSFWWHANMHTTPRFQENHIYLRLSLRPL